MLTRSLLFLFFFNFFSAGFIYAESTQLGGTITNTQARSAELTYYKDLVNFKEVKVRLILDTSGEFKANLDITEPLVCKFHFSTESYTLFLSPGDDLHLTMDARYNNSKITFVGQGAAHNNYLIEKERKFGRKMQGNVRYQLTKLGHEEFKELVDRLYNEQLSLYQSYEKTSKFTPTFAAFAKADIEYWRAYHLLQYRWEHSANWEDPLELPQSYYSFLDEITINNDEALQSLNYTYFVADFLNYKTHERKQQGDHRTYPFENAAAYFSDKTLAYIQLNEWNRKLKVKPSSATLAEAEAFISNTDYKEYARILSKTFLKANQLTPGKMAPDFSLVDINGNAVNLSDYKGKVVLLAFWASWCNPCLHEMPYSKDLLASFSPSKVEFIYVALEKSKPTWQNYVRKHNLTGQHVFANGIYETEIAIDFDIQSVPYYILIDKEGKIAKNPATKPSFGGLKEDIKSLLEGKKL